MSYPNWIYSLFAFLGFVVSIVPLKWTWNSWHGGLIMYIFWSSIGCLVHFIDSIIWTGNVIDWAPVWCDISSHIQIGYAVAIPACSFVINRRLNHITRISVAHKFKQDRIREFWIDVGIALGIPVFQMIIYIVPQGVRYQIYEDVGCATAVYNTWQAMLLVNAWPLAISCLSLGYVLNTLYHLYRKREETLKTLKNGNYGSMNQSQYFRLGALACMELLFTLPLAAYVVYLNVSIGLDPWISWANVHSNFDVIVVFPRVVWSLGGPSATIMIELNRWAYVLCAFVFFGFFGFANEAMKTYRATWASIASFTGLLSSTKKDSFTASTTQGSLPSFTKPGVRIAEERFVKRDPLASGASGTDSFDDFDDLPELPGAAHLDLEKGLRVTVPASRFDSAIAMDGLAPADAFSPTDTLAGSSGYGKSVDGSRPTTPDVPMPPSHPHAL